MIGRRLALSVSALILLATAVWGPLTLTADGPKGAAAGAWGHLFGIVTDKNDKTMTVKPDDPNGTMHFAKPEQNKDVVKAWATIFPDHVVEVKYDTVNGQPVLTSLKLVSPISGGGKVTGIVTDKKSEGQRIYVEVKSGNNPTARYVPMWDQSIKGYTKSSVDAIASAKIGDKVEVTWVADPERVHMTALQVVAKAAPASKPAGK